MSKFDSLAPTERLLLVARFIAEAGSGAEPPQSDHWNHYHWARHVKSNLRLALRQLEVLERKDNLLDYKGSIETAKQQVNELWPKGAGHED